MAIRFAHVVSIHASPPDALFIEDRFERAAHRTFLRSLTHADAEAWRVVCDELARVRMMD
jgi:hypothetical protein